MGPTNLSRNILLPDRAAVGLYTVLNILHAVWVNCASLAGVGGVAIAVICIRVANEQKSGMAKKKSKLCVNTNSSRGTQV